MIFLLLFQLTLAIEPTCTSCGTQWNEYLDHTLGIGEFEMSVDMAREQFETKKGRMLTSDETACFEHVFNKKTTKTIKPVVAETIKIEEEEVVTNKREVVISDDDDEVVCITPKKKKVKLEYADIDDELDDGATCPLCGKIFKGFN